MLQNNISNNLATSFADADSKEDHSFGLDIEDDSTYLENNHEQKEPAQELPSTGKVIDHDDVEGEMADKDDNDAVGKDGSENEMKISTVKSVMQFDAKVVLPLTDAAAAKTESKSVAAVVVLPTAAPPSMASKAVANSELLPPTKEVEVKEKNSTPKASKNENLESSGDENADAEKSLRRTSLPVSERSEKSAAADEGATSTKKDACETKNSLSNQFVFDFDHYEAAFDLTSVADSDTMSDDDEEMSVKDEDDEEAKWTYSPSQTIDAPSDEVTACADSTAKWLNVVNFCLRHDVDYNYEAAHAAKASDEKLVKQSKEIEHLKTQNTAG